MKKLRVGILFGGKSGEHEVSIVSALSVYKALNKDKYEVTLIGIDPSGRWLLPDQAKLLAQSQNPRLVKLNEIHETVSLLPFPAEKQLVQVSSEKVVSAPDQCDVIIPILHGPNGEDGTIQGLLELANIPYVGSGVLGSAIGMDKEVSKRLLHAAGIPIVPYLTLRTGDLAKPEKELTQRVLEQLGLPCFVKPANMGSSVGVYKVKTIEDLLPKLRDAFQYDCKVLIEKAINARELECSVLGNAQPKASIIGEIIPHREFYTYEAKYIDADGADLKIPAENLSEDQIQQIQSIALQAFSTLECSGMARVDFFMDKKTQNVYVNEINTIPGFTSISMYPKLWEASGLPYGSLLDELIRLARERFHQRQRLRTNYEPNLK